MSEAKSKKANAGIRRTNLGQTKRGKATRSENSSGSSKTQKTTKKLWKILIPIISIAVLACAAFIFLFVMRPSEFMNPTTATGMIGTNGDLVFALENIKSLRPDGGDPYVLTLGDSPFHAARAVSVGDTIYYIASADGHEEVGFDAAIYAYDPSGSRPRKVYQPSEDNYINHIFSSDRDLYFVEVEADGSDYAVYRLNSDLSKTKLALSLDEGEECRVGNIKIFNGKIFLATIAQMGIDEIGFSDYKERLYVADLDDLSNIELTEVTTQGSPIYIIGVDNRYLYYLSVINNEADEGEYGVYRANYDGSSADKLTSFTPSSSDVIYYSLLRGSLYMSVSNDDGATITRYEGSDKTEIYKTDKVLMVYLSAIKDHLYFYEYKLDMSAEPELVGLGRVKLDGSDYTLVAEVKEKTPEEAAAEKETKEKEAAINDNKAKVYALSEQYFSDLLELKSRVQPFSPISSLATIDIKIGNGKVVDSETFADYSAYYICWKPDGSILDSSFGNYELKAPLEGDADYIEGWSQGIVGMKIGGVREIAVPSNLAYGDGDLKFIVLLIPKQNISSLY